MMKALKSRWMMPPKRPIIQKRHSLILFRRLLPRSASAEPTLKGAGLDELVVVTVVGRGAMKKGREMLLRSGNLVASVCLALVDMLVDGVDIADEEVDREGEVGALEAVEMHKLLLLGYSKSVIKEMCWETNSKSCIVFKIRKRNMKLQIFRLRNNAGI